MKTDAFTYSDGVESFIGHLAWDERFEGPTPAVLIAPAFGGLGPFEKALAEELAGEGYVALALDYYGHGKRAEGPEEARALMAGVTADRQVLARRMLAAFEAVEAMPHVDASRVGALGFCLGGKAVLDLARTGADIKACIPIHGVYDAPNFATQNMCASVLVLHGWNDPLAPPEALSQLADELTTHCEDWQVLGFGHTGHAFTNPNARDAAGGMMYSERATERSWVALRNFLAEKLKGELEPNA